MHHLPTDERGTLIPPATFRRLSASVTGALADGSASAAELAALDRPQTTLAWGRKYLTNHFAKPASAMHRWLGELLDVIHLERGAKINVIGPRGSAKSTIATLCYVLRAALEGWEPYIWIVCDTMEQAQIHLENIKAEVIGNTFLHRDYPRAAGVGAYWRATSIELANGVALDSFGTGQSVRGRRRSADRPSLIICDDLQNDSHISSAGQRETSRQWFQGTLLNAGTKDTNIVNLATALHRDALALELHRSAGWTSRVFFDPIGGDEYRSVGRVGLDLLRR